MTNDQLSHSHRNNNVINLFTMTTLLRFFSNLLIVLVWALRVVQAETIYDSSNIKMECLALDEEFSSFRCLNVPPESVLPCINTHPNCKDWASRNECAQNPQFMLLQCRQACNSCISLHHGSATQIASADSDPQEILLKLAETQRYLHQLADDSGVENLKTCINKHELCTEWSLGNECEANPNYMRTDCALACQMC